jgi:hypothetical protein
MKFLTTFILFSFGLVAHSQVDSLNDIDSRYEHAFGQLNSMLAQKSSLNFKKAVFITEWAYLGDQIDTVELNKQVTFLTYLCHRYFSSNNLQYDKKDVEQVKRWGSIFKVMTDTMFFDDIKAYHLPFTYDFEDFFGEKDWSKMFVSKLLETWSGNCHSLPYLYKILAEELGVSANLALAPNHVYIKHKSMKTGWYNTELTSATFPIDAWLVASGYIHLNSIQNRVYLKALDDKESIALCLIDLAEGYKRKTSKADPEFILKCCNTALQYFPNYINALLLKAETMKSQYDLLEDKNSEKSLRLFNEMQDLYVNIHNLGYRQMPKEMYIKWLVELKTEKEKYLNKNVTSFEKE